MKLSNAKLLALKPRETPYRQADGLGLYIEISPSGGKLWRLKYRFGGVERRLAFGTYPDVSLAQARGRRDDARRLLAEDKDPSAQRKLDKARGADTSNTFEAVANEWLAKFGPQRAEMTRKHHADRLRRFVFPRLGQMQVADIRAADVLAVLRAIEVGGSLDTAHRVRQLCGQVLRYAVASCRAERDVTSDLRGALPPAPVNHMASITDPKRVGPLLRAIDGYDGGLIVRCALQLAPMLFVRPGELRAAEWSEFDEAAAEWNIPAARMKMREPHLVPLSSQALAILAELRPLTGGGRYVFPSMRSNARPMSNAAVNAALRRMGYGKDEITGHGFRATARTILDEQLHVPAQYIEHQLAHAVKGPLGNTYNRTQNLPERKAMMQQWADYLDGLKASNVIQFPTRAA